MENQRVTEEIPTENQSCKVNEAALWMSQNADSIRGNHLLEIMARFGLSVLDATEASKRGHALRYPRVAQ
jgi:hypothetical protein